MPRRDSEVAHIAFSESEGYICPHVAQISVLYGLRRPHHHPADRGRGIPGLAAERVACHRHDDRVRGGHNVAFRRDQRRVAASRRRAAITHFFNSATLATQCGFCPIDFIRELALV